MPRVFVYVTHRGGVMDDTAAELAAAAKNICPSESAVAVLTGCGADLDGACDSARAMFAEVWKLGNEALATPNAELIRAALLKVLPKGAVVLVPWGHLGMDLAPGLSVKLGAAYAADVLDVAEAGAASLTLARQEFGGVVNTHVRCDISTGAVITIRPGAFPSAAPAGAPGTVTDKSGEVGVITARRRYVETIVAETGDVDITKHQILISVGRGIQEQDNIGIAEELAEAVGGAVSCSRPVVDAKWLDKSRQVGSSGKTVQPKLYMACGISGSFQHVAGLKGKPFIVAINKDPKAPIFRLADVGVVDDILEFLPELTEKVRETVPSAHAAAAQ